MTLESYTVFSNFTTDIQRENFSVIGYGGDVIRRIGFLVDLGRDLSLRSSKGLISPETTK